MPEPGFGVRLHDAVSLRGPLCVGIDPHPYLLEAWGLDDSASGLREFGLRVVEAAAGRAAIIKPQVAFFERHGSKGYAALEVVMGAARDAGLLVIADVKRGDLGTSLDAYAGAWLATGSSLEADAMTVSAYQGVGSLSGAVALAQKYGKGLFVLAATSNPEGAGLQTARMTGRVSVAASVVSDVVALNRAHDTTFGSFGVVLGATVSMADYGISVDALSETPSTPILAPGFGFQGATFSQLPERFGTSAAVIVSVSRSVLEAGPNHIAAVIEKTAEEIAVCLA